MSRWSSTQTSRETRSALSVELKGNRGEKGSDKDIWLVRKNRTVGEGVLLVNNHK